MGTLWKPVAIVVGLLALLTYLLFLSRSLDVHLIARVQTALQTVQLHDTELTRDILRARAGLLPNYDPLARTGKELLRAVKVVRRQIDALSAEPAKAAFDVRINTLASTLRHKLTLVEYFKSDQALLRNSLAYFSHPGPHVSLRTEDEKIVAAQIDALSRAMLRFMQAPDPSAAQATRAALERLSNSPDAQSLRSLVAHGRLMLAVLPRVDALLRQIIALPTAPRARALQATVLRYSDRAEAQARTARLLLYLVAVVLLAYVIYQFLRLRASEEHFRAITESANDAIVSADTSGNIVSWNKSAETIFGYPANDMIGAPLTRLIPPRYHAAHLKGFSHWCATGESRLMGATAEFCGVRNDGTEFPMELSLSSWSTMQGKHTTGIIRDLSERKRLEQTARQQELQLIQATKMNAEALEAKVSERTQQLEEANLKLEAASRHKSQFLAHMSHELRTPLNGILGYAQILRKDKALTAKQRNGLEIIHESGEHLLGLINELLDLSRIESHQLETNLTDFSLKDLLDNLKSIFEPKTRQHNLKFRQAIATDLSVVVHGERQKLNQILLNLIDNAIKFTARGEVVFSVSRDGERVCFAVNDTGCGIKPEDLKLLFQPFQQVGEHRQRTEGTGLGLAISRAMVETLGGSLQVESEFGKGSRFWFSIPLPESDVMLLPAAPQRSVLGCQGARRRVLIVDDIEVNRAVLMDMLKPLGFDVAEAHNGQAAIEIALIFKPDLILMDIRMPVMDGLEATRRIRQIEALQKIVIIPISASAYTHHRSQCLEAGADDFLPKPFRQEALLELLRTHLGLELIYAEAAPSAAVTRVDGQAPAWVYPPEHELAVLVDLARRGEVKNILKRATQLEQSDARYAPFAAQLRGLAEGIKIKELREFLNASTQP